MLSRIKQFNTVYLSIPFNGSFQIKDQYLHSLLRPALKTSFARGPI